jgi:hypothetical protein
MINVELNNKLKVNKKLNKSILCLNILLKILEKMYHVSDGKIGKR